MARQVGVFLGGDCCVVVVSRQDLIKESSRIADRNSEDSETEVEHIDTAPVVKVPSVTDSCWEGHLSRRRDFERFNLGHVQTLHCVTTRSYTSVRGASYERFRVDLNLDEFSDADWDPRA
jgi:hypothetical protein